MCQKCIPQTLLHDACMCGVVCHMFYTHNARHYVLYPCQYSLEGNGIQTAATNVEIQGEIQNKMNKKSQIGQIYRLAYVHIFSAFWEVNG